MKKSLNILMKSMAKNNAGFSIKVRGTDTKLEVSKEKVKQYVENNKELKDDA